MNQTLRHAIAGAVLAAAATTIGAPSAYAQSCQALWVERNSYYKDAGYCFKTARAIRYFGNRGCAYDNEGSVPLSFYVRNRIEDIKKQESLQRCN